MCIDEHLVCSLKGEVFAVVLKLYFITHPSLLLGNPPAPLRPETEPKGLRPILLDSAPFYGGGVLKAFL